MKIIPKTYSLLSKKFGPQHWWPASSKNKQFEIILGAILTQNTNWKNVELAINNLIKEDLIDINKIKKVNQKKLAKLIRSAGYYNQKSERLKIIATHLSKYASLNAFFNRPVKEVRDELLSIKGIGPETADSVLLYAGKKPIFVIDAYTKRISERIGIAKEDITYHELQELFMSSLPKNQKLFNEYHALLVELGKNYCKTKPVCENCPLKKMCKKNG